MQAELLRSVGQQIAYEAALDDLRKLEPTGVDIENAFVQIRSLGTPNHREMIEVLDLAATNIPLWVNAIGSRPAIEGLSPYITAFRDLTQQSDNTESRNEFTSVTSGIVARAVMADPNSYEDYLALQIQEGQFGDHREILPRVLGHVLREGWGRSDFGYGESGVVARMIDEVLQLDDPTLVEPLKSHLPMVWLSGGYEEDDLREQFPRVHRLLERPLVEDLEERHRTLANMFLEGSENQREALKTKIKAGEFGDGFETIGKVLALISSEESTKITAASADTIDSVAEDLWIELLEIDRHDPRLRPLRERFIEKEWYWDDESVTYTLVETLNELGIDVGDERSFITRHEEAIGQQLLEYADKDLKDGITRTIEKRELGARLAVFTTEVRKYLEKQNRTPEYLITNFSDGLLMASLYTPKPKSS